MKRRRTYLGARLLCALVWMAALVSPNDVLAIEGVRVTPGFVTVNAIRPRATQSVAVTWQVEPFQGMGVSQRLFSPGAQVETDQGARQMIATFGGLPPQTIASPVAPMLSFPDSVQITRELVAEALSRGAQRLLYTRRFSNQLVLGAARFDLPAVLVGQSIEISSEQSFSIAFTTNSTGSLVVFGAELRFDEGTPLRVLKVGEPVRVFADLSYAGTGPLEAVWEIADEGSPDGVPLFRPLRRVRRFLGAGQRLTLEGPQLRTQRAGPHLVRLRLVDPTLSFELPTLRYLVGGARAAIIPAIHWTGSPIQAAPGASLSWSAVAGAAAYRLEVWEAESAARSAIRILRGSEDPTFQDRRSQTGEDRLYEGRRDRASALRWRAAKLVPATSNEFVLNAGLLEDLEQGARYAWRVVAVDARRQPVARSPVRWLLTEPAVKK